MYIKNISVLKESKKSTLFLCRGIVDYITEHNSNIYSIVAPVVDAMGYTIVELTSGKVSEDLHIHLIIHTPEGIGIDDCSRVHRTIQKRIEALNEDRYFYLEVSSPGITRNFKSANEFAVFKGRHVRILLENDSEWIRGIIGNSNDKEVEIQSSGEMRILPFTEIKKAKLDFSGEV